MHEPFDITTIIFALLAIFVLFKLRSVLGARTGSERPPRDPFAGAKRGDLKPDMRSNDNNVVPLPGAARAPVAAPAEPRPDRWTPWAEPKAWEGLDAILAADPGFEAKPFLDGARAAYEMIVAAFAAGDQAALSNLLDKDVFDSFAGVIKAREARGEKVETTIVSLDKTSIDEAQLRGGTEQVSVRFLSKMMTVTRGRDGAIVDGDPQKVADMVDLWTFARVINARDPNWKLIATETAH